MTPTTCRLLRGRGRALATSLALASLTAMSCISVAQRKAPGSLTEQQGDIGIQAALQKLDRFRALLGAEAIDRPSAWWRIATTQVRKTRIYRVDARGASVDLDCSDGRVVQYYNTKRIDEQIRGKMDRSRPMLKSKAQADALLAALAAKLSGRSDLRLHRSSYHGEGDAKDANKSGRAGATCVAPDAVVNLGVDILDGALVHYLYIVRK